MKTFCGIMWQPSGLNTASDDTDDRANNEWEIGIDSKGDDSAIVEVRPGYFTRETEENHENISL
jgi:hypothetical protein